MPEIINHDHPKYRAKWSRAGNNRFNGAFFYSKEICKFMIPAIETDRNWITINIPGVGADHAIVFIHNNLHPEHYDWLAKYEDLILVCGIPETVEKVSHLGKAIYLPLSIDVEDVKKYAVKEKTKDVAFVGRKSKRSSVVFIPEPDYIEGLPRTKLLPAMAQYRRVYAVGRTAIEAKALGCEILPYDPRFPDPARWQVLDTRDAARILQDNINQIDKQAKAHNIKETDQCALKNTGGTP